MQENKTKAKNGGFSLLNIILKNLVWIVIATIIGLLAGLGVAAFHAKPSYTATKRVMLVTKYSDSTDDKGNEINSAGNDFFLAKIYLPNAIDKIKSPLFVADANDIYQGETKIVSSAISAKYGEESLIFSLSYTDADRETAIEKLNALIGSAKLNFPKPEISVAKDSTLREVENRTSVTKNSNFAKYILIGAAAGLVLSALYVVVKEMTDNTIKDKDVVEEITGASLLACIDDIEVVDRHIKEMEKQAKKDEKRIQKTEE